MSETKATTIEALAADFSRRFEGAARDDGSKYRRVKEGEECEALTDLIREAHGDMLPDDYRYRMIEDALDAIAEGCAEAALESSIWTGELTAWLASHLDRVGYVDEAREEWGEDVRDTAQLLALGMAKEQDEVLQSVLASLEELVEESEEEEEDGEGDVLPVPEGPAV